MAEEIPGMKRVTLEADKNYDTHDFVREIRWRRVTPHVAQNNAQRRSAIDQRTTRHPGAVSQRKRTRVEEIFGWVKTVGLMHRVRHRGHEPVAWMFTRTAAIYEPGENGQSGGSYGMRDAGRPGAGWAPGPNPRGREIAQPSAAGNLVSRSRFFLY